MSDQFFPYEIIWMPVGDKEIESKLFFPESLENINLMYGNPYAFPDVKGVYIFLDEKTNRQDIINHWEDIEERRDEYYEKFGFDFYKHEAEFETLRLYKWNRLKGIGTKKLSLYLNFEASIHLIQSLQKDTDKWNEIGYERLRVLFQVLNLPDKYEKEISEAKNRFENGEAPWDIDQKPIPESKLVNKIAAFDERLKSGEYGLLGQDYIDNYNGSIYHDPLEYIGYFEKDLKFVVMAIKLIRDSHGDMWKKKQKHIFEIIRKVKEKTFESDIAYYKIITNID